ncbi:MAG: cyanophycinase [Ignavibacteriales bacterium]|nr:MAG: cyanophycinase [Ignavibacteriaceae bacterium]MBW7873009.1 cyanophycinase [Ignavibacteria bacterium]MCZ2142362.1 cyanophycinase [Ignavibacteriales bacterium]OQY70287.1 MAG: cyanophycinase [Ignavibacteriales bacterium UTCHB3]MBV6445245.1 Cyanophycinase [Ignavibacteriaceae bacterium]
MKKLIIFPLLFSFALFAQPKGKLFIIGGGQRSVEMMTKFIELAGGYDAKVVIIPNASELPRSEVWDHASEFEKLGCKNVKALYFDPGHADDPENLKELEDAKAIFFSGGDQVKLRTEVGKGKLYNRIKEIYENGGVVGGTSAGAAVMSKVMITGNELVVKDSEYVFFTVNANNVETKDGFGFLENVIIDQHFLVRKRQNRLICVAIEHQLPGIGIDESTAIIVEEGRYFTVLGESGVLIINPLTGKRLKDHNGLVSARDITMHLLMNGDRYDMQTNTILNDQH